jgi:hypothetical protein
LNSRVRGLCGKLVEVREQLATQSADNGRQEDQNTKLNEGNQTLLRRLREVGGELARVNLLLNTQRAYAAEHEALVTRHRVVMASVASAAVRAPE